MLKGRTKKRKINFFGIHKRRSGGACSLDSSEDDTSPRRSPPKRKKVKKATKMKQMHLDFGQRNFGAIKCPHCNMIYTPGILPDEAIHAKFCSVGSQAIQISSKSVQVLLIMFGSDMTSNK